MEIFYIQQLYGIGSFGDTHYKCISPKFDSIEKAKNWSKEHNIELNSETYSKYIFTRELIK